MQESIKKFEKYYDETKNSIFLEYIKVIETKDFSILEKMSLNDMLRFFEYVTNYDYFEKEIMEMKYVLFNNESDSHLLLYILEKMSIEEFYDSNFVSCFNSLDSSKFEIIASLSKNLPKFIVEVLFEKSNLISFSAFKTYNDIVFSNDLFFRKFMKGLTSLKDLRFHSLQEEIIVNIYKSDSSFFQKASLKDKIDFVDWLKDDKNKKFFFNEFNLDNNIDLLVSDLYKYVDQDKLVDYFKKTKKIKLKFLDEEHQYNFIRNNIDLINKYFFISDFNWDAVERLLKEGVEIKINLLADSDNKYVLDYIKNKVLGVKIIDNLNDYSFLFRNSFLDIFSESEVNLLKNKISIPNNDGDLGKLLSLINDHKIKKDILNVLLKNIFNYINNNELNSKAFVSLKFIKKYIPGPLEEKFIEKIDKSRIIRDSVNDKENFDLLMFFLSKYPDMLKSSNSRLSISKYNIEYVNVLMPYMCTEYRSSFFQFYDHSEVILKYMKKDILDDYTLVDRFMYLEVFDESVQKNLLRKMSYSQLIGLIFKDNFSKYSVYTDILFERKDEAIKYINSDIFSVPLCNLIFLNSFSRILYSYDNNIENFIDKINCNALVSFYSNFKSKLGSERFFEILGDRLKDSFNFNFIKKEFLSSLSEDELNIYIKNVSFSVLFDSFLKFNSDILKNKIMDTIKKDDSVLYDPFVSTHINDFLLFINDSERKVVESIIDSNLKNSKYYDIFKDKIDVSSFGAKVVFTKTNEYLNDEKLQVIKKLFKKDKFLFDNLDYRLFTDDLYCLGIDLIILLNRYPMLVQVVYKIMNSDFRQKFIDLNNYIISNINSQDEYSEHMWCLLYFYKNFDVDGINDYDCESLLSYVEEKINLLFVNIVSSDVKYEEEYTKLDYSVNYKKDKELLLDKIIESSDDIEEVKNVVLTKIFGFHGSIMRNFIYTYGTNYEDVRDIVSNDIPYKYMSLINKILDVKDIDVLKEIYYKNKIFYNTVDYIRIKAQLDKAYNKAIVNDFRRSERTEEKVFIINGKEVKRKVTILENEGLFVHSTDAYGSLELINNDYFDSWQYNPNTENIGICTCYISNSNQGTPPVNGSGVMFGFRNVDESSIGLYAPYDIISINDGIKILSTRIPLKMRLNKIPDFTRHTHNEFVWFRRDNSNSDFPCLMPTSVVIYEDMPDSIKENSLKAVEDFRRHGVELEIIYRDRKEIALVEAQKIEAYINEYYRNNDLKVLECIINKYESNICGFDFVDGVDTDILFKTDLVLKVLNDTLNDIELNNDKERFNELIEILERENYKFKIIEENIGNRAHSFVLYDNIKNRINAVQKKIYGGNNEFRK